MKLKFEMSDEARKILELAKGTKPGDLLGYRELHNLTGVNDIARLRGFARTAFRSAFRKWGMRFIAERGIGYLHLDETGKTQEVSGKITHIRRQAKRANRLHGAIALSALDQLGKLTYITNATQLSEIKKAASRATRNYLAEKAADAKAMELVFDETIQSFKRMRR